MKQIVAALLLAASLAAAEPPEVVSVRKIWDAGEHNAFSDLIRFRDQWFCAFREGGGHVSEAGLIRVISSNDAVRWQSAALIGEAGIDLRDPKLSVTPDGRLMIATGGTTFRDGKAQTRQSRVLFSTEGTGWSKPRPVLSDGHWLWRVTWHEGRAYGISYLGGGGMSTPRQAILYSGTDGIHYERIAELEIPGASEATARFLEGGEMMILARREADTKHGWIGTSLPPYEQWKWREIGERLGGPNFIRLPNGELWAGSRYYSDGPHTTIARLTTNSYEPLLTLPSGGDNSYPGLVWHEGFLWVSYYSSHEGKTSIYLAKVKLPD